MISPQTGKLVIKGTKITAAVFFTMLAKGDKNLSEIASDLNVDLELCKRALLEIANIFNKPDHK